MKSLAALLVSIAATSVLADVSAPPEAEGALPGPVALLPVENLTGAATSTDAAAAALREALDSAAVTLVGPERLDAFFDSRRVRYRGGLSRAVAPELREATGAPAALVASLDLWDVNDPPRVAMTARLVTTGETPTVIWMDSVTLAGDDEPGFLQLGLVHDPEVLLREAAERLVASLVAASNPARRQASVDEGPRRFRPRRLYLAPDVPGESGRPVRVAVVPFTSRVRRRSASDVVQMQIVRQLAGRPEFEVLDPGVVRQVLLDARIIPARGVSLAQADTLRQFVGADLVVSGNVYEFKDGSSASGDARVDVSLVAIDSARRAVAWTAFSGAGGSDGLHFFELGRLRSGAAVTDALSREIVVTTVRAQRGQR